MHILTTTIFSLLAVTASANVINRSSPTSSTPSTPSTPSYLPCTEDKECGRKSYCDSEHQRCVGLRESEEECTANWGCFSNWCLNGQCKGNDAAGKPCNNTETDCSFYVKHGPYEDGEYTFCPKDTGDKPRTCMLGHLRQGDKCTLNEQCAWDNCVNVWHALQDPE
ncbi:hypothetical protein PMG11_10273 [Penicillium brasilianum]|uniref:Dickkopf N-terminal cysteine-rich domain-containing protein n=1 Tax=Penicillium brasilianum TaxID=104259 RepID=A0A0F7TYM3_PENBI|nr:hypothetical protein PMG11_10273 [Penicillium brasilianum]